MNLGKALDHVNQSAWNSRDAKREFTHNPGWSDPGERAAVEWVASRTRGQPILDIGVGAGRTVPLLTALSKDYTAVDYTQKLIDLCKERYPEIDLRWMDARDMSALPSNHYAFVQFSWNGIDCVDYDDRMRILQEMKRVTRPGGLILFSSHNRGGPGYREPFSRILPVFSFNPVKLGWRTFRTLRRMPIAAYNYLHNARLTRDFEGYSIATAAAHNFGIVIVYTTLAHERRQIADLGLELEAVFGSTDSQRIPDDAASSDAWWLHFVAKKPEQVA
ncbi:class I SAM-dependent methyltransferase [Paraburkholderia sp. GAS334]|jgi:SAM-dependent methyltransferase|uniref:class I SAM-dependent methyltransferase n=1 Tax=Paraburkholderia sp. GAS334 TaxID=3035131 RepID=UPI003D1C519E